MLQMNRLILQLTCRDLNISPISGKQSQTPDAFNHDFIWLTPSEAAALGGYTRNLSCIHESILALD